MQKVIIVLNVKPTRTSFGPSRVGWVEDPAKRRGKSKKGVLERPLKVTKKGRVGRGAGF